MKQWVTEIQAICPKRKTLIKWSGPHVPGINLQDAENYLQMNGLGYCKIVGELIAEIPCKKGTYEPDWNNRVDYDIQNLN